MQTDGECVKWERSSSAGSVVQHLRFDWESGTLGAFLHSTTHTSGQARAQTQQEWFQDTHTHTHIMMLDGQTSCWLGRCLSISEMSQFNSASYIYSWLLVYGACGVSTGWIDGQNMYSSTGIKT